MSWAAYDEPPSSREIHETVEKARQGDLEATQKLATWAAECYLMHEGVDDASFPPELVAYWLGSAMVSMAKGNSPNTAFNIPKRAEAGRPPSVLKRGQDRMLARHVRRLVDKGVPLLGNRDTDGAFEQVAKWHGLSEGTVRAAYYRVSRLKTGRE